MNSRQSVLKRIKAVYGLVEEMHSVELRRASASVDEAKRAIGEQRLQSHTASRDAHSALAEGDRERWMISEVQRSLSGHRGLQLDAVRLQRERVTDQARQEYHASRIRSEQIKTVVERNDTAENVVAGRRTQAAADDRFLSRLRWNLLQSDGV